MKLRRIIYVVILLTLTVCSGPVERRSIDRMKMDIEIVPETYDGGYAVYWYDTLGSRFSTDERYLEKRPNELYCHILNDKNDTLGYYIGLSSPRQWTYFKTASKTDSIIYLNFRVGVNHFSSFLADQSDEYIRQFNEMNKEQVEFMPIRLNINSALRTKKEVELVTAKN